DRGVVAEDLPEVLERAHDLLARVRLFGGRMETDLMPPGRDLTIEDLFLLFLERDRRGSKERAVPTARLVPAAPHLPMLHPVGPEGEHRHGDLQAQGVEHIEERAETLTVSRVGIMDDREREAMAVRIETDPPGGGARGRGVPIKGHQPPDR